MEELTFWQRITSLFKIITSSPFFIVLMITFLLTIIALVINGKTKNKVVKIFTAVGYMLILLFLIITYGGSFLKITDNFVEKVFTLLYFPNIISYICMIVITTLVLILTIINKKMSKFLRYSNIFVFIILEFLFILTLDVVVSNNIDIYSKTSIYSNKTLIVLIQSSMEVFAIWFGVLLIDFIANTIVKSRKKKTNEKKKSKQKVVEPKNTQGVLQKDNTPPNITKINSINDNINIKTAKETKTNNKSNKNDDFNTMLTDAGFNESFKKKEKYNKYKKYLSYVTDDDQEKK